MRNNGKIRHLFPGGNTTEGFHSFFDHILKQEDANHIISIKGGPGVGKSSLMKKLGEMFIQEGYDVEYHHCSSDPDSLDGLVVPKLKVSLVDGTAPHIVDPKNPGAVDEILNLGAYWKESKMKANKADILRINKENGRLFNKAYQYLKAAGIIYNHCELNALRAFKPEEVNLEFEKLKELLFEDYPIINEKGNERHLFAYGITPKGVLDFREDTIELIKYRVVIKESIYSSAEELMNTFKQEAIRRGLDVQCFHSPLKINKIEDIIIDELDLIISVDNLYHKYESDHNFMIDLTKCEDKELIKDIQEEINDDINEFKHLLTKAIGYIKKAKENHDILEDYYVPYMDFSKHDELTEDLFRKLSQYK